MNNIRKTALESLIEKADSSMIEPACIQNGNSGSAFTDSYKEQTKENITNIINKKIS